MENLLIANTAVLSGVAFVAAVVLYFTAKKFFTETNPLTDEVNELLPQANCGACGKAGCAAFAEACANAKNSDEFAGLYCPVGGKDVMSAVADKLGFVSQEKEPTVAVLKCHGTCENAPDKVEYIGLKNCRLASRAFVGKTGCPNGCLRFGDCVSACPFDAISIDETGMPVVDAEKCTSCGNCVKICPRGLYEIRPQGKNGVRVYVACSNTQKGAIARKNCKVACIGCMKCTKITDDVKVENNLSYIPSTVDAEKHGEELMKACPTGAIIYTGSVDNE